MYAILRRWPLLIAFLLGVASTIPLWAERTSNPIGNISITILGSYSSSTYDPVAYDQQPVGPKVHCKIVLRVANNSRLTAEFGGLELIPRIEGTEIRLPPFRFDAGPLSPNEVEQSEAEVSLDPKVCSSL